MNRTTMWAGLFCLSSIEVGGRASASSIVRQEPVDEDTNPFTVNDCAYVWDDLSRITPPNICFDSYSYETGGYSYLYECNATNEDYFLKKEWFHVTNNYACYDVGREPDLVTKLERSKGYDFNCSEFRANCTGFLRIYYSCEDRPFNDTAYVCGTCLIANDPTQYASIQNSCQPENATIPAKAARLTLTQYDIGDQYCKDARNATNTTYIGECESVSQENILIGCSTFKS